MSISLYNTLSKKKEPFTPLAGNKVRMYVCGVTVYDMCHIGHARSLVVFDVIARFLRRKGYDLTYVRNFTDVDDKIIARANQLGLSYKEIAQKYIDEFYTDMKVLKVKPADIEPRATEHIEQIITMIEKLESKGLAYKAADGSVYFDVSGFREYGKLSGRDTEEMIAGARVEIDENKRNPLDFALWKRSKEGEPWWESPWSKGRPGWHIECSAMSTHLLGPTLDIHGGGRDLVFPHHENETAQSEGTYGVPFVRYWVHNGFVTVDGEKMSKSLGNFLTIRELVKEVHPEALRLLLVSHHYRSPIDFSPDAVQTASQGLVRFYEMLDRVNSAPVKAGEPRIKPLVESFEKSFDEAMSDDFNTALAVARIHELTTEINKALDESPAVSPQDKAALESAVSLISDVLGILEENPREFLDRIKRSGIDETGLTASEIEALIEERNAARKAKDFRRADEIRDTLKAKGIQLKDTPEGTIWEKL
ncbi:MAG: cysteine--tRNA ligase [Pseudomonadota bacterium]|jgi:cysteinyl-tRNA synthetase|uniref:Cysteine--tRNA ligase n=1 Tax=anaerobic digester metagenome TaxID=1263854 RepID=A0A485M6P8_9ZZZZ|nr:cysteine--tRNA ligase [Pseudomonadota bacterium]HON38211.1 cysteine--tRNA ligase [Deltaproteobacteria bacterium]HRS56061.1 cysteine--tRNA ligase [Desulfomonilia bacterium]HPD21557.1 cysteine--tRNA ligase [Deltaproteobacteria bacterium]HPX19712.1 cysteine--tRNA ligase [Deltaproteobacteria bacterium]